MLLPLVFSLELAKPYELPKWCLVSGVAMAVSVWALTQALRGNAPARTPLDFPLLGALAVMSLSAWFSSNPSTSFLGLHETHVFGWVAFTQFLALYYGAACLDETGVRKLCGWAVAGGSLAALYGIAQYFGIELSHRIPSAYHDRVFASLGNPVFFGNYLAALFPLALYCFQTGEGTAKAAACVAMPLLTVALILSLTRGAWLGAAAGAAVYFACSKRLDQKAARVLAITAMGGTCAAMFMVVTLKNPWTRERLHGLASLGERANSERVEIWKGAVRVFLGHPWLGSGPDTFKDSFRPFKSLAFTSVYHRLNFTPFQAHGDFFQLLATTGAFGAGLYLCCILVLSRMLKAALSVCRDRCLPAAVAAALAGLLIARNVNASSMAVTALAALLAGAGAALWKGSAPGGLGQPLPLGAVKAAALAGLVLILGDAILAARMTLADYERAQASALRRFPPAAVYYFRQALSLNPACSDYRAEFAASLETLAGAEPDAAARVRYLDEAAQVAQEGVRRDPLDPDMRNQLGVALMWQAALSGQDRWAEARRQFDAGIELDPTDVVLRANRARLASLRKDPLAARYWEEVLSIDPGDRPAQEALALLKRGQG